jgi:hypothetical protein
MKYIGTLLIALFILSLNVHAQKKKYSFGFEVAPNISWGVSNTKKVENNGATTGIKYGIKGDSFFGKNYAITSGIMISHTSLDLHYNDTIDLVTIDDTYDIEDSDVRYNIQYVEIPLGMKFQSNEIGYFRVLIEGGFLGGVRIKSKVSSDEPEIDKEELEKGISLFSLAYYFEGGVTYSLGAQISLKGTVYFSSGILDMTPDKYSAEDRITQNSVGMKIGLVF